MLTPKTEIVNITPAQAALWLERNTANRHLRPSRVEHYARDMVSGQWMLTHQGIAFDESGALIDGQHRLHAIVKAGVPVQMLVMWGASSGSRLNVDSHAPRSYADAATLSGLPMTTDHIAVVRAMRRGANTNGVPAVPTRSEAMEWYKQHASAIDFAIDVLPDEVRGVSRAPVRAAVARAYYHEDHGRLRQFGEVMISGMIRTPVDAAAIVLRNFLLLRARETSSGAQGLVTAYRKVQGALKKFCERQTLTRIYEVRNELYPLNGEE